MYVYIYNNENLNDSAGTTCVLFDDSVSMFFSKDLHDFCYLC